MTNCTNLLPCRDTHHVTLAVECHFLTKVGRPCEPTVLFLYYQYRDFGTSPLHKIIADREGSGEFEVSAIAVQTYRPK